MSRTYFSTTERRRIKNSCKTLLADAALLLLFLLSIPTASLAQSNQPINLTLDTVVEMAVANSYNVRQLHLGIERSRNWLKAERAALKSKVYMNLTVPEIEAVSNNLWNSDLHRYELIRENSRMWQMNFAIQQPVILFGYPTNGYLSLNNRIYRYTQLGDEKDVRYYNRYFVKFEQPFFQPNSLKNQISEAELDLERVELEYQQDIVQMLSSLASDYYDLFELAYKKTIYGDVVNTLEVVSSIVSDIVARDSTRLLEMNQVQVELANARERLNQTQSNYRLEASRLIQRLGLNEGDSLVIHPVLEVKNIKVNLDAAIQYGMSLRPELRILENRRKLNEIQIQNAKGWDSFRANLEITYGREMQDPRFEELWANADNSWSVGLHAYVPIWDWGRRKARIQAQQISLQKTELYIEESEKDIRTDISNYIKNLEEYQKRASVMRQNLEMARQIAQSNLIRYRDGQISILNLLQSIDRQAQTAENFLTAFLGYKEALISLQTYTYYDFERNMPLFERFRINSPLLPRPD